MQNDVTYLGKIIRVDSNSIEVEISDAVPSATPIINGKIYKVGQIGTFIKIPSGNITTYGIVDSVSNVPHKILDENIKPNILGNRYLTVSLIGEKIGNNKFEKGVGVYPTINEEVHMVTDQDLEQIYCFSKSGAISLGKHASSDNLNVYVDLHKLVLRHSAILGSTGSGKSNSTVSILKKIISDYTNSRIVLIDPHGEYGTAFPHARIFRINDKENPLVIPFWLMNYDELAFFLVGSKSTDDQKPDYRMFRELIVNKKKKSCNLKSGEVNSDFVTADSPIPFNVRSVWYEMNWWINASFSTGKKDEQTKDTASVCSEGNPEKLEGAKFTAYARGNKEPYKSQHQEFYSYEKKLLRRLRDSRYDFLFHPGDYNDSDSPKDLHNLLSEWIGGKERLTILDLSNVPFEVMDITVGLITRFIYDSMFWGRDEEYTGKNRPVLLAYDEAHAYLGKDKPTSYSKIAVERVFKEGRKFGVGAMIISQRPSEISETILAQIGTFIALRLTNSKDQGIVKSLAPDNMNSLINFLPALRIGEGIIVGEAIEIPSRVRLPLQKPTPSSSDPDIIKNWKLKYCYSEESYKSVVKKMREQKSN